MTWCVSSPSHGWRWCHRYRRFVHIHCPRLWGAPQSAPALIHLHQSLGGATTSGHRSPSFFLEDEGPYVAVYGSARLAHCTCRTRQLGSNLHAPPLGPAYRHNAASFILLGLLRLLCFGQVCLALHHRVDVNLFTDVSETFPFFATTHHRVVVVSQSAASAPASKPRSTTAQSVMNVAPGSDRIMACSKAQSSARMMRRSPCAEKASSCVTSSTCTTAHPVCQPCAPCLQINDPFTNNLPPTLLPATFGAPQHELCHRVWNRSVPSTRSYITLHPISVLSSVAT